MRFSLLIKKTADGAKGSLSYTSGRTSRIIEFDVRESLIDTDKPFLNQYLQNESITLWRLTKKDFDMINEYIRASYSNGGCVDFCADFSEFKARHSLHISERGNVKQMQFSCSAPTDVTAALLFYFGKSGWKLRRCAHCGQLFFSDATTNESRYCDRFSPMPEYKNKTCVEAVKAALDDSYLRRSIRKLLKKEIYDWADNPEYRRVRECKAFLNEHDMQRQKVKAEPTPDNIRAYQSWKSDFIKRCKEYFAELRKIDRSIRRR